MEKILKNRFISKIGTWNKKTITPSLIITYLLMVIIFSSLNKLFLSPNNFKVILITLALPGIVALGNSFVLISRNLDISVGSIVGFTAIIIAKLFNIDGITIPIPVVIIIAILVGASIGTINGILTCYLGINSVIVTLGTLSVFRGLAYIFNDQALVIENINYNKIGRGYIFDYIPIAFIIMVLLFLIFFVILKYSRFGKYIYAVGGNENIAKLYGIKVKIIRLFSFIISGATSSIAAVLMTSQLSFGIGDMGTQYEFIVLTIVVLGGISIRGGRGSLVGVFVAIFIYGSIANGLTIVGVPIEWRETFLGLILIFAIILDSLKHRSQEIIQ